VQAAHVLSGEGVHGARHAGNWQDDDDTLHAGVRGAHAADVAGAHLEAVASWKRWHEPGSLVGPSLLALRAGSLTVPNRLRDEGDTAGDAVVARLTPRDRDEQ